MASGLVLKKEGRERRLRHGCGLAWRSVKLLPWRSVVNRYGGLGDRWWWDMVLVVFMGAGFHDEGRYGVFTRGAGFKRWGRSEGGGGPKVGDSKQQDWKTNKVDSVTILWVRSAKAGLAWPRGEIDDG
ncbi:hypothetical protein CFP56_040727 [Quercus suber]|uniref:Uncharacterized protein n=1 Tax=Quercus suber TaxID=58331 RepID=A0AAW0IXB8_QUESU|nr:hypothetical protein CFP56_25181 [Quercus suber]